MAEPSAPGTSPFRSGPVWRRITESLLSEECDIDLETFRSPGAAINSRLASWDPGHRSHMFFKHLLLDTAAGEAPEVLECFRRIGNTGLGAPLAVEVGGLRIDLDYLLAAQEAAFLIEGGIRPRSIVEVGGGFGRTCHALMRNLRPERYAIVDLPETLALSRAYLRRALEPGEFARVDFIPNESAHEAPDADLWLNIDSFAEMEPDVVHAYLSMVDRRGRFFYSRNPVCKYSTQMIGAAEASPESVSAAMASGVCRQLADIFSESALAPMRSAAEDAYRPSPAWAVRCTRPSAPYRYYQHLLYGHRDA